MKRFLILVIALILAACLLAGCSGETEFDEDAVETINTKVKQEFTIARRFDLNSGYIWREDYNESMLELVDTAVESSEIGEPENPRIVLSQVFQFKALKKGKTKITLTYKRATLSGPLIAQQETINVNIK